MIINFCCFPCCRLWAKETLLNTDSEPAIQSETGPSDALYFESYAHYSIHEEMLKVKYLSH